MSLVAPASAEEIARLLAPVDPKLPCGLFDIEDDTYQAIDQEMVKLGGLHETSIDWLYIEEASREYLSQQCKHLRIVVHLGVAWLRNGCWEHWNYTLQLLAGMVEHYWECAYPKPGPQGLLGKRKLVELLFKRLAETLPRLDRFSYTAACTDAAQKALTGLQLSSAKFDQAVLAELQRLLLKHSQAAISDVEAPAIQAPLSTVAAAPLAEAFVQSKPSLSLGNERETRRALLSMADFINQQDVYDPTGYQLRRFGLWAHIQAAPSARQDHRTELMRVPADIAAGYEEAIVVGAIDPPLLLRVEKSVAASPYWIRGSFLAANIATHLAMSDVAEAIRSTTARFVRRLPALQQLSFSDGSAFVDAPCLAWLKGDQTESDQQGVSQEFRNLREELVNQLDAAGVEPVLLKLQGLQADFRSPRERSHSTVIAADLLAARGVSWLARDLCVGVARTMQQMTAEQWEPEVFQRLQQYEATSTLIDRNKEQ
ncbi:MULTISPECIES: type VI secretion system protein TssA [unclassified Pseudomonas]|uniref:type VI secretion system protein TssA n=1 Tax=unclassified Pseudomonas TaxID=196821 RepID=UPI00381D242F